jgi:hypothetical protein
MVGLKLGTRGGRWGRRNGGEHLPVQRITLISPKQMYSLYNINSSICNDKNQHQKLSRFETMSSRLRCKSSDVAAANKLCSRFI